VGKSPVYFEYDSSAQGTDSAGEKDWLRLNFAQELFELLRKQWHCEAISRKRLGGRRALQLPALMRVGGGVKCWTRRHEGEVVPWYGDSDVISGSADAECSPGEENQCYSSDPANTWTPVVDPKTNLIVYQNLATGRRVKIRPLNGKVLVQKSDKTPTTTTYEVSPLATRSRLFSDTSNDTSLDSDEEEDRKQQQKHLANEKRQRELSQDTCDLCRKALFFTGAPWVRLVTCRCAICPCCVERTILFTRFCPVCGDGPLQLQKSTVLSDVSDEEIHAASAKIQNCFEANFGMQQQFSYLSALQLERAQSNRVVLEYGSTAMQAGGKTTYTTFLRVINITSRGSSKESDTISVTRVDFNINPGFDKPTATVSKKDAKNQGKLYEFEYSMARRFPCFMIISFGSEDISNSASSAVNATLPKLKIEYMVQDSPHAESTLPYTFKRRIVIQMNQRIESRTTSSQRKAITLDFDQKPGNLAPGFSNVWIRVGGHEGPAGVDIEFLPEGGTENAESVVGFYSRERTSMMNLRCAGSAFQAADLPNIRE
jgi:hypothetical protein